MAQITPCHSMKGWWQDQSRTNIPITSYSLLRCSAVLWIPLPRHTPCRPRGLATKSQKYWKKAGKESWAG